MSSRSTNGVRVSSAGLSLEICLANTSKTAITGFVLYHRQTTTTDFISPRVQYLYSVFDFPTIIFATLTQKGSYASALSLNALQDLGPEVVEAGQVPVDADLALAYAPSKGTPRLRERVAELHSGTASLTGDDVVITPGSIMANYLVLSTICGPGDHIICQYPTYGQLYLLPKYSGVEVTLWEAKENDNWGLDIDGLATLIKPNTKAIVIKYVS